MTEFNNRVRDSEAVANLRLANATLSQLAAMDWEHQTRVDFIDRLTSVGNDTLARLSTNRDLITQETLNDLESPSQEFLSWVNSLPNTSMDDDSYWHEASNAADSLLMAASTLPALRIRTTSGVFERVAEQFDHEAQSTMNSLLDRFAEISSELADIGSRIEQTSTQFNEHIAQFEARASDQVAQVEHSTNSLMEEARVMRDSLLAQTTEATERLEREVTSIQEVFRDSQGERDEDFKSSQGKRDEEFHGRLDPTIAAVEGFRDQARSMLEEVAGAGTAEHYVGQSQKQNKIADIWRWIGVGALIVMVLASAWVFYEFSPTGMDISVTWLIARTGLLGPILILAAYALRQSGHHRRQAESMGRLANELQLLWPFMNQLPSEHREALLLQITPLYFRGESSDDARGDSDGPARRLLDRLPGARVEGD